MGTNGDGPGGRTLPPDEAFAAIGNETRVGILKALAGAEEPLAFSDLHDEVDIRDSGQFSYHLDKLLGHFLEQGDDGYELRRAGRRIVEAILSGAVTDDPVLERSPIDGACHLCGAPREVSFHQERVATYCTECDGIYPEDHVPSWVEMPADYGFLGFLHLPPAGLEDRTPTEVHRAARTWNLSERLPAARGVCPRCSGTLEMSVNICEDHDGDRNDLCSHCDRRYALGSYMQCANCPFSQGGVFSLALLAETELLDFLTAHGINPIAPDSERFNAAIMDYEEKIHSRDPLEASVTFSIDGDSLTLPLEAAGEYTDVVPMRELEEE